MMARLPELQILANQAAVFQSAGLQVVFSPQVQKHCFRARPLSCSLARAPFPLPSITAVRLRASRTLRVALVSRQVLGPRQWWLGR